MAWYLKRQGVQGRPMDTTAMDAGTAFHAMMAEYWGHRQLPPAIDDVTRGVRLALDQEDLQERGIVGTEVMLGGSPEEAERHGRYPGTCDLVTENGTGLTVTDYKSHRRMEPRFADRELRETERSWQLNQYAYFIQKKFSRPVTKKRKLLVAFAPVLKVWLIDYPVTQPMLTAWYRRAEQVWALMDRMETAAVEDVWQDPQACEKYGWEWRCQYHELCWP